MWTKTYSKTVSNIKPEQIWKIWADVNHWHQWDSELEWAKLENPFEKGVIFYLKPKGGPKVKIEILECIPNQLFTNVCKFPFAKMYDIHQLEETQEGLRITNTIKVTGLLSGLWRKLVAEKVSAGIPQQTEMLINHATRNS